MFLEFPDYPACAYLDQQYVLGSDLLVAPVFSEDNKVTYYLPEGEWTQVITGEKVKINCADQSCCSGQGGLTVGTTAGTTGGCWRTETHGFMSLPLWRRSV
jgi:alpha-D-xyloside xylohydrolase